MSRIRKKLLRTRRDGLSILEVLVSIGILVLGLLGVVALIPIAAQHLRRGIALDDATAVVKSGLAEFQARGGNNLQKWLRYQPGVFAQPNVTMNNLWGVQTANPFLADGLTPQEAYVNPSWSFCIDPMMYEGAIINNAADLTIRQPSFFPYQPQQPSAAVFPTVAEVRGGLPSTVLGRMIRVSMNWNAVDWRQQNVATSLNVGLANSMCVSADDLLLRSPGQGSLGVTVTDDESPAQQYDVSMNSWDDTSVAPVKRNAEGRMSWFATMVPLPGSVADGSRYYTLSVAVCERRDMVLDASRIDLISTGDQQEQDVESERTCAVRFVGGGQNGGEVQLVSYIPPTNPTDKGRAFKSLSRLREGNWILVSGPNTPAGHIFYWYRIGTIESEPQGLPNNVNPTQVVRNATLRGPDWPGLLYTHPTLGPIAEATIVSNVINVFEHTIELRGE